VDSAGAVYVTDAYQGGRVLKLAPGADHQVVLTFTGLRRPGGVAVDKSGAVYVTDVLGNRVLKLPPGADAPVALPLTGLNNRWVWRWTPPATFMSPIPATTGC
jgi:serine/threonine protein kinase, bacterial